MVRSQTRKPELETLIPEDPEPHPDALFYGLLSRLFGQPEPMAVAPPPPPAPIESGAPQVIERIHHQHTVLYRRPAWIELVTIGLCVVNLCLLVAHMVSP